MLRQQSFNGPWPAIIGGLVAIAFSLVLRTAFGTRLFAELVVDASTYGLQPRGFSFFVEAFANLAKPLLFVSIILLKLSAYLIAWRRLGQRFLRTWGIWRVAIASAASVVLLILIASAVLVLATPATMGSASAWLAYVVALVLEGGVFAVVAVIYATGVGEPARASSYDSRRAFLARMPAVLLGGAALIVIVRRIIDTAGGGAQAPSHYGHETPEVTPNRDFYIISKNLIDPQIDASDWDLKIGGLAEKTVTLKYDDIKAMRAVTQYATLQCISNEINGDLESNADWTGVPLKDVLDLAGPKPEATHVFFRSEDDFTSSLEISRARADEVLLAYEMNGQRLPDKHGYPLRLLLPGKYGMRNPKWITEIMLMDENREGYWEKRGWSPDADMNTSCRIDIPSPGDEVTPGASVRVAGVAFAGKRGISKVEVSTDKGETWADATMKVPLSPLTWVLWTYDWQVTSGTGQKVIMARATDGTGETQTAEETPPYPSGATGYPSIPVFYKVTKA